MYPLQTVLTRNTPLSTPDEPDALDVVKVVGVSPIKTATREEWAGGTGEYLVIQPVEHFGANETAPASALQAEYSVTEYGDETPATREIDLAKRPERVRLESPEEQFARRAREDAAEAKKAKSARA